MSKHCILHALTTVALMVTVPALAQDSCLTALRSAVGRIIEQPSTAGWTTMYVVTEAYAKRDSKAQIDTTVSAWGGTLRYGKTGPNISVSDDFHMVIIMHDMKKILIRDLPKRRKSPDPLQVYRLLHDSLHSVECKSHETALTIIASETWCKAAGLQSLSVELQMKTDGWKMNGMTSEYSASNPVQRVKSHAPTFKHNTKPLFERSLDLIFDKAGALKSNYRNYHVSDMRAVK